MAVFGSAGHGMAGQSWLAKARELRARLVSGTWQDMARQGTAWHGWAGMACEGKAGRGRAWNGRRNMARNVTAGLGLAGGGEAGKTWPGMSRQGKARQGGLDEAGMDYGRRIMSMDGTVVTKFLGEYRFLSNFAPWSVAIWGTTWPTAEHAFQAAKSLEPAYRQQVLTASHAGVAKRLGRAVTLRPDWELVKVPVMCDVVTAKFANPYLVPLLRSTGTALLVEGNDWHDQSWGDCHCGRAQCESPGRNALGLILMTIRAGLR